MFTDNTIAELHKDKEYKKSNGFFKNVHLSRGVVKTGIGSRASLVISSDGDVAFSFSTVFIRLFWIFLRYKFITDEITSCRSKIIEELLHRNSTIPQDKLIESSIMQGSRWLAYDINKIDVVRCACIEYIGKAEHRIILSRHSCITDDRLREEAFLRTYCALDHIFKAAHVELTQKRLGDDVVARYRDLIRKPEGIKKMLDLFSDNSHAGNLTTPFSNEEDTKNGS